MSIFNFWKISEPVYTLVKVLQEDPLLHKVCVTCKTIYTFNIEGSSEWLGYVSNTDLGYIYVNEELKWMTYREKWYLYKAIKKICEEQPLKTDNTSRKGWMKKLGVNQ